MLNEVLSRTGLTDTVGRPLAFSPQQDRSTALFTLAAELPAAILARMLGVHIQVAVQWQKASGGDWAAYAADVSQRSNRFTSKEKMYMPLDDQHAWALLRELDDPDHMEFPRGHDHTATRARFDQLATRLDQRFQCTCIVDRGVQDASHHGTIVIPDAATASGEHITVAVSNFGNLAAVTLGNPGSYDEEEECELFQDTDRHRVDDELEALGCIRISEHLLWTRYGGVSDLVSYYPPEHPPTWWTRFFDYL